MLNTQIPMIDKELTEMVAYNILNWSIKLLRSFSCIPLFGKLFSVYKIDTKDLTTRMCVFLFAPIWLEFYGNGIEYQSYHWWGKFRLNAIANCRVIHVIAVTITAKLLDLLVWKLETPCLTITAVLNLKIRLQAHGTHTLLTLSFFAPDTFLSRWRRKKVCAST